MQHAICKVTSYWSYQIICIWYRGFEKINVGSFVSIMLHTDMKYRKSASVSVFSINPSVLKFLMPRFYRCVDSVCSLLWCLCRISVWNVWKWRCQKLTALAGSSYHSVSALRLQPRDTDCLTAPPVSSLSAETAAAGRIILPRSDCVLLTLL